MREIATVKILALGHSFSERLVCGGCDVSWRSHQEDPQRCPVMHQEQMRKARRNSITAKQAQMVKIMGYKAIEEWLA
jgi:hypothetical protein